MRPIDRTLLVAAAILAASTACEASLDPYDIQGDYILLAVDDSVLPARLQRHANNTRWDTVFGGSLTLQSGGVATRTRDFRSCSLSAISLTCTARQTTVDQLSWSVDGDTVRIGPVAAVARPNVLWLCQDLGAYACYFQLLYTRVP